MSKCNCNEEKRQSYNQGFLEGREVGRFDGRKEGAIEQKEKDKIDFIRLEVMPKSKKKQYRVFFKDGTEQVFELEGVKQNEF